MGSILQTYTSNLQGKGLLDYHSSYQEQERIEGGCYTYSGHMGIMPDGLEFVKVEPFANVVKAEEYIAENHSKWERAMAVPFKGRAKVPDKKSEKLMLSVHKAEEDLKQLEQKILAGIRNARSRTIKCKCCESTIRREYLRSADCPVCVMSKIFYSNTHRNQLKRKLERIAELRQRKVNRIMRNTTCYVVGGYCAC